MAFHANLTGNEQMATECFDKAGLTMKTMAMTLLSLFALTGCNSKEREARQRQEELDRTFSTRSYNYTKNDLDPIVFKESADPFKIDEAPSGGAISSELVREVKLDNGEKIRTSMDDCCFMWNGPVDKPKSIRVVWLLIHNRDYYPAESNERYDAYASRKSPPGARWCQAIVDIRPATGPERPDRLLLHFLPDGTVQAQLSPFKMAGPLPAAQVRLHATPLPEGVVCRQEIENPWYGKRPKPYIHRE